MRRDLFHGLIDLLCDPLLWVIVLIFALLRLQGCEPWRPVQPPKGSLAWPVAGPLE